MKKDATCALVLYCIREALSHLLELKRGLPPRSPSVYGRILTDNAEEALFNHCVMLLILGALLYKCKKMQTTHE